MDRGALSLPLSLILNADPPLSYFAPLFFVCRFFIPPA
jgi:hypothetical protein